MIDYMLRSRGAMLHARFPMEHIMPDYEKCVRFRVCVSVDVSVRYDCMTSSYECSVFEKTIAFSRAVLSTTYIRMDTQVPDRPDLLPHRGERAGVGAAGICVRLNQFDRHDDDATTDA